MLTRKVQVFVNGFWVDKPFEEIKEGDYLKMFESDGTPVKDEMGHGEWIVTGWGVTESGEPCLHCQPLNEAGKC